MKQFSSSLTAHLATGTTTLCTCWRLTLATGEELGFTDHDRTLVFDGTTFESQSGFTASELESSLGMSVDNLDASGALESSRLDAERLKAGDFDHAEVQVWQVNWIDVAQRHLIKSGHLGEVTYGANHFTAEVRGLAHLFNQPKGRLHQYGCDAELGDSRCGVNADAIAFRGTGIVTTSNGVFFEMSGLASYADDWFTRGFVEWLTGANAGRRMRIKRHRILSATSRIELWSAPYQIPQPGDQAHVIAGCDKQLGTCQSKFENVANFRGFPHMPGTDFVMQVASAEDPKNDGGRRRS